MSAWVQLHAAALELAKSTPLKQRLLSTFTRHLTDLDPADLTPAIRPELRALLDAFESVPPLRGESSAQATIRKMSNEQAEELAARVITLFGQVARSSSPRSVEEPVRSPSDADADVLPLFATGA